MTVNLQPTVNVNSVASEQGLFTLPAKTPYIIRVAINLVEGGITGYMGYWVMRGICWIQSNPPPSTLVPLPLILSEVVGAGFVEVAKLIPVVASKILGERAAYENNPSNKQVHLGDRLRNRCWKVVRAVESVDRRIDTVFSKVIGIRTKQFIKENNISDLELSDVEIIRRAFQRQVVDSLTSALPRNLGVFAFSSLGFVIPGMQFRWFLTVISFLNGVMSQFGEVRTKQMAYELEKKEAEKNKQALASQNQETTVESSPVCSSTSTPGPEQLVA